MNIIFNIMSITQTGGGLSPLPSTSVALIFLLSVCSTSFYVKWGIQIIQLLKYLHFKLTFTIKQTVWNATVQWITAKDTQINIWRNFEAKRQRHHGEVEGVDAVDLFERVGVVCPHVGFVGLLGRLVEIVVLLNQLLQLKNKTQFEMSNQSFSFIQLQITNNRDLKRSVCRI